MAKKTKTIARLKAGKAEREAFVTSQINIGLPFQIRALRKQRGWDQKKLADEAGMAQPRISAIEKIGGASLNLETLKRLAAAFDIGLVVRFAPFSELAQWSDNFYPDDFAVLSFDEDIEATQYAANSACVIGLIETGNSAATVTMTGVVQGALRMTAEHKNIHGSYTETRLPNAYISQQLRAA